MDEFIQFNPGIDPGALKTGDTVKVGSAATRSRKSKVESRKSGDRRALRQAQGAPTRQDAPVVQNAAPVKPTTGAAKPANPSASAKKKPAAKHKDTGYLSYYDSPVTSTKDSEPSVTVSLVRVVLSLILVVALAYLSLLALKRFTSAKATHSSPRRNIRVLETAGLGANRALHVVQIDGRQLLVGSTASQVNLIAELDASGAEESEAEQPASFAGILRGFSSNRERANTASKLSGLLQEGASFLQKKTSAARSMRKKGDPDEE